MMATAALPLAEVQAACDSITRHFSHHHYAPPGGDADWRLLPTCDECISPHVHIIIKMKVPRLGKGLCSTPPLMMMSLSCRCERARRAARPLTNIIARLGRRPFDYIDDFKSFQLADEQVGAARSKYHAASARDMEWRIAAFQKKHAALRQSPRQPNIGHGLRCRPPPFHYYRLAIGREHAAAEWLPKQDCQQPIDIAAKPSKRHFSSSANMLSFIFTISPPHDASRHAHFTGFRRHATPHDMRPHGHTMMARRRRHY